MLIPLYCVLLVLCRAQLALIPNAFVRRQVARLWRMFVFYPLIARM